MAKNPPTTIRLSPEVQEALEQFADDDSRSVSAAVEVLVGEGLTKRGYLTKGKRPGVRLRSKPSGEPE